jgi:Flp pilus assembly protein TadB
MAVRFVDRAQARPLRRFLRMFRADRKHLHHLLDQVGARRSHAVALIYAVVVAFCLMALVVAVTGQTNLGLLLVVIEFLVIFGMRQMGRQLQATRLARPTAVPPLPDVREFPAEPPTPPCPTKLRVMKGR